MGLRHVPAGRPTHRRACVRRLDDAAGIRSQPGGRRGLADDRQDTTQPKGSTPMSATMTKVDGHPGVYRRGSNRATARADVSRGEYRQQSNVTFAGYASEWITSYTGRTKNGISETTRNDYRRALGLNEE